MNMAAPRIDPDGIPIPLEILMAVGEDAPSLADKVRLLRSIRGNASMNAAIDEFFVGQLTTMHGGLLEAQSNINELKGLMEQLTAPPLIPARFLGRHPNKPLAQVVVGNNRIILPVAKEVDLPSLQVGDEVVLNHKQSVVLSASPLPAFKHGQTAAFQRLLGDGRMIVRSSDEETILGVAPAAGTEWRNGDMVRWDPVCRLALEKIPRDETGGEFRLEAIPDMPLSMVGGQQENLHRLISALTLTVTMPEAAKRYAIAGLLRTILLHGPPGTGKTFMVKAAGAHLQRVLGRKVFLSVVKPGAFEDPYVGVTQRRIRECFQSLRQADGIGLLFIDEIESIGRARGGLANVHGDKFLGALLVEMQGLESDGKHPCALIAATNRPDMLDAALYSRIEMQLHIGRPDAPAAREIFAIHLAEDLPYRSNGHPGHAERQRMIDRAVTLFYSPNAVGPLATLKFRDGSQRTIMPAELASGRCFEQICRAAKHAAMFREVNGGEPGMIVGDIEDAVSDAQRKLGASLTRHNIHQYLSDLRQDMEIVALEPVVRRVDKPHRFLNPQ
jgi:proteasome-associated ATPase